MPVVTIRPAVSTDIEQILRMDSSAQVDQSRQALVGGECFVAVNNGILFGYGVMNYGFFDRGFVSLVYVGAAHRRNHVGSSLFDHDFIFQVKWDGFRALAVIEHGRMQLIYNLPSGSFWRGWVIGERLQQPRFRCGKDQGSATWSGKNGNSLRISSSLG
jgi:hypothetical protein